MNQFHRIDFIVSKTLNLLNIRSSSGRKMVTNSPGFNEAETDTEIDTSTLWGEVVTFGQKSYIGKKGRDDGE